MSNGILTASSLAYFGEPLIGRRRGVVGGEGVEGGHVEDIPCGLGGEGGTGVGGGVRGVVGEIAHWTGDAKKKKRERGVEERLKANVE